MSAKREKIAAKDYAPDGAFAGGTPAVPASHLLPFVTGSGLAAELVLVSKRDF